jgi:hypothetical protein
MRPEDPITILDELDCGCREVVETVTRREHRVRRCATHQAEVDSMLAAPNEKTRQKHKERKMKTILAIGLSIVLAGTAIAQVQPVTISQADVTAAAKATIAPQGYQQASYNDSGSTGNGQRTAIIVILCVLVVGAGVYLIAKNANQHGSGGLSKQLEGRPVAAVQYRSPFLRQAWAAR